MSEGEIKKFKLEGKEGVNLLNSFDTDINSLLALNSQFEMDIQNDIYNKFKIFPLYPYNNIQVQLIYPATEQHIQKYSVQEMFFVSETIEDYNNLTLKFIEQTQLNLNWVYNILEHKKESERIIFEDPEPVDRASAPVDRAPAPVDRAPEPVINVYPRVVVQLDSENIFRCLNLGRGRTLHRSAIELRKHDAAPVQTPAPAPEDY
ncbi:m7 diphosphatase, partial [Brachionus plicatilis]